jgi:hypothetical protein
MRGIIWTPLEKVEIQGLEAGYRQRGKARGGKQTLVSGKRVSV